MNLYGFIWRGYDGFIYVIVSDTSVGLWGGAGVDPLIHGLLIISAIFD